jgi:hypothetical protein
MRIDDLQSKVSSCLQCGKKLSLLKLLAKIRFCSNVHEEIYDSRQAEVAVSRLRLFD